MTLSFSTAILYTELVTPFKNNIAEPMEVLMEEKWEHFSEKKKTSVHEYKWKILLLSAQWKKQERY